jgi:outer membrane protein OmpA-like peptidoglycan-associated protein
VALELSWGLIHDRCDCIREIRIEGHTDSKGEYLDNLNLSSGRALKVQEYILKGLSKRSYTVKFQGFVKRNSIACGYSSSRLLDSTSHHIIQSHLPEDRDKSRRVEFRVILEYKKL